MASPVDNTSNCTYVWSKDTTIQLIQLYKDREVLYNITLKENHDRELRRRALQEIADDLGMTEEEINRKVKSLRAQYGREKLRLSNCPDGVYQSKWHFLPMLTFLDKYMKVKVDMTTVKKEPNEDSGSLFEAESDNSFDNGGPIDDSIEDPASTSQVPEKRTLKRPLPFASKSGMGKVKRFAPIRFDRFSQKAISLGTKTSAGSTSHNSPAEKADDADDIFGKHVAAELRSVEEPQAKRFAKLCIQNILFEAQSGITSSSAMSSPSQASQPQFPSNDELVDRYSSLYQSSPLSN